LIKEIPFNQPMIFFPSDNLLGDINQFNKALKVNKNLLSGDNIFIFGIKPKSLSSEYGYFLSEKKPRNINKVYKFIEKPNKNKLNIIHKKKGYMNSGMFFARKDSLVKNFKKYQKNIFYNCFKSIEKSRLRKNVYHLNKPAFKKIKEISFDYAILEKSKNINCIKLDMLLTDLGNWKEIWKYFKNTSSSNFIKKNTYYRPWGKFINLHSGKGFLLKEIIIKPKSSISLQKHLHRSERWIIVSGKPKITINNSKFFKKANEDVYIPKGAIHRIENLYNQRVQIVETQMGPILRESDIIRYKDIYGRVN